MSLPLDLLEQAVHLASREPKRPKQASLRRAVSSAYYALFHLMIHDAAAIAAPGLPAGLRALVARAMAHQDMKIVCRGFFNGNAAYLKSIAPGAKKPFRTSEIPPTTLSLLKLPLEPELVLVTRAFVQLQEARHDADYNMTATLTRSEVLFVTKLAHDAFAAWARTKSTPNATVFKSALLLQKNWGR